MKSDTAQCRIAQHQASSCVFKVRIQALLISENQSFGVRVEIVSFSGRMTKKHNQLVFGYSKVLGLVRIQKIVIRPREQQLA
jgi:hypothetical protein